MTEKLITLGETTRNVSTFGIPILIDNENRMYQTIQPRYERQLRRDHSFDWLTMKAFDFKLKRARGKKWPEPPRVGQLLTFSSPLMNEELCTGKVSYLHLGRKRSVGVIYLDMWSWTSTTVPDFTN